jgi:hypothetical protein
MKLPVVKTKNSISAHTKRIAKLQKNSTADDHFFVTVACTNN